jgi:hypothetical protein
MTYWVYWTGAEKLIKSGDALAEVEIYNSANSIGKYQSTY